MAERVGVAERVFLFEFVIALARRGFLREQREVVPVVMLKAVHEAHLGATIVALLPARTDTNWWHWNVTQAREIRFLKGRLKFVGAENSAPFPSVVVIFDGYVRTLKVRHWNWKDDIRQ